MCLHLYTHYWLHSLASWVYPYQKIWTLSIHTVYPSMTTSLLPHIPVHLYWNDLVPTLAHIFTPTASTLTLPVYPHAITNTCHPLNSLSTLRHTLLLDNSTANCLTSRILHHYLLNCCAAHSTAYRRWRLTFMKVLSRCRRRYELKWKLGEVMYLQSSTW